MRLAVYASEHVLHGYVPEPGDLLTGAVWLHGIPLRRLRQTECWADRVLPESPAAFFQAHERGEEAETKFPDAHPGVLAVINSLGQAGWEIEPLTDVDPVGYGRCLSMRRNDREIHVWVRAFHHELEQDCSFTPEDVKRLAPVGSTCAFVTVKCEDAGTHLRLSYTGHETIETQTGTLRLSIYIKKPCGPDSEELGKHEGDHI
jgi:hypothetical protein